MWINYLKVAFRNIARNTIFSVINILGLAIGLTISFIIILYVAEELSYDKFHDNHKDIYRVTANGEISGQPFNVAVNSALMGPGLYEDYPEVMQYCRLFKVQQSVFMHYEDKQFFESNILFADNTFFDVFSFEIVQGNPQLMLNEPFTVVITEETAKKYFGDENPIGKKINYNNNYDYTVSGVVRKKDLHSHINFDFLVSFSTLYKFSANFDLEQWTSLTFHTYIKLQENIDPKDLEEKMVGYFDRKVGQNLSDYGININSRLQPITRIHLHSNLMNELESNSNIYYVYIFSAIAIFILLLASINFMNLSTAKSSSRAREVGMRKVLGANRRMLMMQFVGEALLMSIFAYLLSLFFLEQLANHLGSVAGKNLDIDLSENIHILFVYFGVSILIGLLSGVYPAFYISSFSPVKILKGLYARKHHKATLRQFLVVFQFTISIALIIATTVMFLQLTFIKKKNLGFNKENIVVVTVRDDHLRSKIKVLKEKISSLPDVKGVSSSSNIPGMGHSAEGFSPEGVGSNESWLIYNFYADNSFFDVMGIDIIEGGRFTDSTYVNLNEVLINETLKKQLGWENVPGKVIDSESEDEEDLKVVGVFADYHFKTLHSPYEPLLIRRQDNQIGYILIKINRRSEKVIEQVRKTWLSVDNRYPFDYFYLEDVFQSLYESDNQLGEVFIYLTILAIIVAFLGLYGLSAFTADQRRKEIAIRKVMGASVPGIIMMFAKIYTRWVIIANIFAWPLAYLFIRRWLNSFEFKTQIPIWTFIFSGLVALVIALITISYQAIKVGMDNPTKAIKEE